MPLSITVTFIALALPFLRLLPRASAEELQLLLPWIPAAGCTLLFRIATASSRENLCGKGIPYFQIHMLTSKSLLPVPLSCLESAAASFGIWDLQLYGIVLTGFPFKEHDGRRGTRPRIFLRRADVECWHTAVWLGEVFSTRIPWRWSDGPACSRWQVRFMYTIITISGAISSTISGTVTISEFFHSVS